MANLTKPSKTSNTTARGEPTTRRLAALALTLSLALAGFTSDPTRLAAQPAEGAEQILARVLDSDPWGLSGAAIVARATMRDRHAARSELGFTARSKRVGPGLAATVVRFSAPAEMAGAGFLQVQKSSGDDERFLYLPELKRARRISGSLRANAFMGTDLSYADLDRRDLRQAAASRRADEKVGKFDCFVLDAVPRASDSQYGRVELWVRKDNFLPLRMKMYDKRQALLKTFEAQEVRRVGGQWFVSRSRMANVQENHTTDFVLQEITVLTDAPDDEFTVRALEKS